jgi:predicted CDP-diglyceride synthetase/phosphatidate cytidylyltransferase
MWESASVWLERVPVIDWLLVIGVGVALLAALLCRRRGGRFRELPGWSGFSVMFAGLLICLSHVSPWISFALLAMLMFAALRAYFFVAPVRPRDRYAVLAAYLAIPLALWPAFIGSHETFFATVPVSLFLFIPVFLSFGRAQEGLLDSMGRTLLGVLFFVFCAAHLGLLVHQEPWGLLELFGLLVLTTELPQRLFGRFRGGVGRIKPAVGIVFSIVLAIVVGFWAGPFCGLVEEDGGRAGLLVAVAVTLGAAVGGAVAQDLAQTTASTRYGGGAFLNRMVPAVYAAPVFFHYINHFA